ncbi:hypothetical protein AAY81_04685 [Denitrobacterium detoxificans]|uniref:Amino acid adenylation domain-containing protein n=2 Tax=Denitrobacterium detoxificans TaxID=79604 RepID=A0A172RY02_9ACTN|nr:hypothetical protein AAY81_04685 [Denitrobacterium detoxificans]SEP02697.1 amino acid adenylation domain-containing protein [Denitrobacterium detoxificans]
MVPGDEPFSVAVETMEEAEFEQLKAGLIQPFDLHVGPLFRMRVIRTPENLYLFTDFHHLVYDGTSMRVIMADVDAAYAGEEIRPESYTGFDVAADELEARASSAYDQAKEWYEAAFEGLEVDSVPHPDAEGETVEYASQDVSLAVDANRVVRFCGRFGITENVYAIAAFGSLLGGYTNSREALFATIYNGRSDLRCARTVSMMVKTLPVHCQWEASTSVADYLAAVKSHVLGVMSHDLFSFAEAAPLAGVTSDVLFAYQGDYLALGTVCGLPYSRVDLKGNATGGSLDFQLFKIDGSYVLHAEYQRNRYSDAFVADMARAYGNVLSGMLGAELMDDISLVDEEQERLLDEFHGARAPYDASQSVVSLFRAAASAHPDNVAVICGDRQLTYRELDRVSDKLAAYITTLGLGEAGDVVSILIPRGLWMAAASLGALKAGCAYQPLDATYPEERLSFMVQDASSKLLITTTELRNFISGFEGEVLIVDDVAAFEPPVPVDGVSLREPAPEDLFILLYTSGTTGLPKGVRITHANLVCYIAWYKRYYGLEPDSRVGTYASYGFDASMMDTYPALTTGSTLVIVPEEIRLDLMAMSRYLEGWGVTHMFMTTQVGRQFAIDGEFPTIRHLSVGGEALVSFKVPEGVCVHNCYGPTECTIMVTVYQLRGDEPFYPIGHTLDNLHAYIVGPNGKRLPIGAEGELWISGPQVAAGYLNRPERTAEAFGVDPFVSGEVIPLYRTGDVVRWMRDGNIEYIGRRDGQVKIRGFRIELSEVEAVVREFPSIRDATVAAFDHPSGGKYVAAYIVADEPIDVGELGDFIRERKPPYMVPAAFVQLDTIPLNQNGKVNRRALPEPNLVSADDLGDDEARPMNALERELHAIAAEVIGVDTFGVGTPLVRCGLTSIQSLRLLALIYKRLGVQINASDLDDSASVVTIEDMIIAEWMAGNGQAPASASASKREFAAPLTFAQAGVYFECLKHPESLSYNVPSVITFAASVSADQVVSSLETVVAAHPVLTTHFVREGERILLVPSDNAVSMERVEVPQAALPAMRSAFPRPFDLDAGPLCRFVVATSGGVVHLLADFHHLVFDGASMGVFLRDLGTALGGASVSFESFTYSDFAIAQKRFEESPEFDENRAFFSDVLADFETASELPPDKTGRASSGGQGIARAPFAFDAVEDACKCAGTTPAAFMLAAASYALSRYVGERRVYFATISSGRSDVRTADTIGMFVNTLPLAVSVDDVSVSQFVESCASALSGAIAHERYPFARIASAFGFEPQIVYEYQLGAVDVSAVTPTGDSVMSAIEGIGGNEAKFKLSIHIELDQGVPVIAAYYNDALYSPELMEGLVRSMAIVADRMFSALDAPVRALSLLDEDRCAQLERFHEEETGPLDFSSFHEGLERQARIRPDETALVASDGSYAFAGLNACANRIAHALIERGVSPASRVALLLPRTSRVIAAAFGVCKAGCAYIPCDPAYPAERVSHILTDSRSQLVITTADRVSSYENAVDVEELLACTREEDPRIPVDPHDLAYLIYTSGSTGKPKGVMLTHEGVCNFHANRPSNILVHALVEQAHAFLAVTTLSFDMSVKEVFTPIANGLCVVLADESQVNDPAKLAALGVATGADAFNATHSRLKQYLESPAFASFIAGCKVVLSGGEKYAQGLLPLLQRTTSACIINTYGPTETTVSSNMADLTHAKRITVGRPLYNVRECIVDADGNELPPGVVGELFIGGLGVGQGYNDLPEKTAQAFIEREGRRFYRSGDYARWTNDGFVEILGRTDNQVKLRGLRIELGEVESALAAVEGVTNAIVKIAPIGGADHLCAYFTADHPLDAADVRAQMARSLASYMVPTAFLQLDELPLTPNGKVDFRALPPAQPVRAGNAVAAANEMEQVFCDIFSEILGVPDVGATDSFFETGGTSLMAIRVTVEAEKRGWVVSYADVFANPTPRALAALCGEGGVDAGAVSAETTEDHDAEIADYDYSAIDDLLSRNNLRAFIEGDCRPLGNILLAGAVGYLGIHVLHEFLEHYDGVAYCLLRAHGDISAEQRLKHQLFYYFERNYSELFGSRIIVVEGDVTAPLQLPNGTRVDTVVNCAAVVKHFSSGTEIEDVNVGGVENLVGYCLANGASLVQVSTGSTMKCPLVPGASIMGKTTERQLYVGQDLKNKYTRSKFLAERIVLDAVATKGLSGKVMRVGNLAPRTTDGEFQINYSTNASMGRLKSFAMLGCAPFDQLDASLEFSPIDQTARALLLLAQTPPACVVFHPFNHHRVFMNDIFAAMHAAGLEVRPVEREEFAAVLHEAENDPEKARVLTSMLAYARKPGGAPVVVPQAGNDYTMQVLYRLGFRWDATSAAYVRQFLVALEGMGFFDDEEE